MARLTKTKKKVHAGSPTDGANPALRGEALRMRSEQERDISAEIDYWRQLDVFSPTKFKKNVTVIGAGATGSYCVWLLAKMGCKNITVYDFDEIENYNIPNQMYGVSDVGKKKVDALAERIKESAGIVIKPIPKRFEKESLNGIVFVLTDTMESRQKIWEQSIRYQLNVDLLIETRMSVDGGMIYTIRPSIPSQITGYEKTLYPDSEAEESVCTRRAIAPTAAVIAGIAVSQMINYANNKPIDNEIMISLSPHLMVIRKAF